jgi:hypothetical protein
MVAGTELCGISDVVSEVVAGRVEGTGGEEVGDGVTGLVEGRAGAVEKGVVLKVPCAVVVLHELRACSPNKLSKTTSNSRRVRLLS